MIGNFITLTADKDPSIFSRESDSRASDKYSHVNTDEILDSLDPLGWKPFSYNKVKRNVRGLANGRKNSTAKHMLRLRNTNDIKATVNPEGCGEITIVNSHDTTSTVLFAVGWIEFICGNGLLRMSEGSYFKLRHTSITTSKVIETVTKLAQQFPQLSDDRDRFLKTPMKESEALEFAREAALIRFPSATHLDHSNLLRSRYSEQSDLNLWNVYNNCQRNLFNGGFQVTAPNKDNELKTRKVKKINAIDANVRVNGALWELLDAYGRKLSPSVN